MSFVDNESDLEASKAIALEVMGTIRRARSLGVAIDAVFNLFSSYLGTSVEMGLLDLEEASALNDDFHQMVAERLARGVPQKAVH